MFGFHRSSFIHGKEVTLVEHQGIFREQMSLYQAVALIVSGTIGAGILGIPYAIAQVGIGVGVAYIIAVGLLMMGMNLLLGEIAAQTNVPLQLAGLAGRYLGKWGKAVMTILVYTMVFGVLTVYIIGEGDALSYLFGGSPLLWSIGFFLFASVFVSIGMRTVKMVGVFLSSAVLIVVLLLSAVSVRHIDALNYQHINLASLLFPFGVLLFAFHGTTTIPEAHSLIREREVTFKKAIILSSLIVMAIYLLFALVVVGVTGSDTTEIATVGLGKAVGPVVFLLANIFAALSMGTSFLVAGVSLKDSLHWDFQLPPWVATVAVCTIPLFLFLFGVRGFISTIGIVGGVLMSTEMLLILAIYWRMHRVQHGSDQFHVRHAWVLLMTLVLALLVGTVYSVGTIIGPR